MLIICHESVTSSQKAVDFNPIPKKLDILIHYPKEPHILIPSPEEPDILIPIQKRQTYSDPLSQTAKLNILIPSPEEPDILILNLKTPNILIPYPKEPNIPIH